MVQVWCKRLALAVLAQWVSSPHTPKARFDRVLSASLTTAPESRSRFTEDIVGSDTAPDDVTLAGALLRPVLEGSPAVWRPGHLVHPRHRVLNTFYSQTGSEVPSYEVRHELLENDMSEPLPLLRRKSLPVVFGSADQS